MATNKMLIDASHPEETRVVVMRGNRIEEFDFESQNKRQLRGNIYLAKVTRVEPSLQAAFVDYGGNRHGFLAFSEIHPDYYQIPVADRQALLEEEAAEERRNAAEEDDEPRPRKSRRTRRRTKSAEVAESDDAPAADDNGADEPVAEAETEPEENQATVEAVSNEQPDADEDSPAEQLDDDAEADVEDGVEDGGNDEDDGEDTDGSRSIAAVIETDSISEPAPPADEEAGDAETAEASEETEAKPAKRRTRRTTKAKSDEPEEKPKKKARGKTKAKSKAKDEAPTEDKSDADEGDEPVKPVKKRATTRRKGRSSKADVEPEAGSDNGSDNGDEDQSVESVGLEDALEEVPQRRKSRRQYKIQEVIKRRQVLLVQVVKEERGTKGAALTTYLSLAGRYSVLMPNTARGGGISRKITNANDRKRLKAIASELEVPDGMGVILRTAGASRTKAEIKRDFEYLMRLWENVRSLTLSSSAPCLVYEEGSLIKRSIRDLYDKDTSEVLVAGEDGHREAKEFMTMLMPSHARRVKLFSDDLAIFAKAGIEQQLDRMLSPQVTLRSGGYLVINQTEALVAIDVNSGRATREHSIEDTALQTNLEAAEEVSRQLRLRDLAGLIVIDFIDMEEKRNNRAVEKRLKDCLKHDRARIQVGRISHFGLLEMSRQRMRASMLESTSETCPLCGGTGHVRSTLTVTLHLLRSIEDYLQRGSKQDLIVRVSGEIAMHVLNQKRQALIELEERFGVRIVIEADPTLLGEAFQFERGGQAGADKRTTGHIRAGVDDDERSDGRRGRRRRRRRGGEDDEADASAEAAVAATEESERGDDDEAPKRKRRRGKRGGRRNRRDGVEAAAHDMEAEAQDETAEPSDADDAPAQDEPEKPKPARRTRSRKADAEEAEPAAAEPQSTDDTVVDEAPVSDDAEAPSTGDDETTAEGERPRRRTTRRPRKAAAETVEPETTSEPASEPVAPDAEDDGDKRAGWWSRNGFF